MALRFLRSTGKMRHLRQIGQIGQISQIGHLVFLSRIFSAMVSTSMTNYQPKCHCKLGAANLTPEYAQHVRRSEFINTVCGLLIESRFGPGAHYDPIVELTDRFYFCAEPADLPDEYFDLILRWPMPSATARPSFSQQVIAQLMRTRMVRM